MTEAIKIIDDDVKTVLAEAIADYEKRTGKILQPAHIERSIIQTYAYREQLLRK
ncbi:phage baseplate protein, partial [Mannheimia haemolytica]